MNLPAATYKKISAAVGSLLFILLGKFLGLDEESIQNAVYTAWVLIAGFASQDFGKEAKKLEVIKAYYESKNATPR